MYPTKYHKWYANIIQNAAKRVFDPMEYYEMHHILPRSLGGSDDKSNLAQLTSREHFVCHLLLVKMYPDTYHMRFALHAMCAKQDSYARNSHWYTRVRNNTRGIFWFNNGIVNRKFNTAEQVPEGWVRGKKVNQQYSSIDNAQRIKTVYYNPQTGEERREYIAPEGWVRGRAWKIITDRRTMKWHNVVLEPVPAGWVIDVIQGVEKPKRTFTIPRNKNSILYTDGKICIRIPEGGIVPEGFKRGNISTGKSKIPVPVRTPFGDYTDYLDFCKEYNVDRSFFDNLNTTTRSVGVIIALYNLSITDMNLTKYELGFKFIHKDGTLHDKTDIVQKRRSGTQNKGKKCYTNGIVDIKLSSNDVVPEGFYLGTKHKGATKPKRNTAK